MHSIEPMHVCLNVDEILRLLVHELVGSEAKATAVALACCCKCFEDPALDVLWETQDQVLVLLGSLPEGVWNENNYNVSVPTTRVLSFLNHLDRKSFKRLPTTHEWARFRKYARRMRMIREVPNRDFLSLEVFDVLEASAMDEPLLPNLKALESWSTIAESIPFISSFISPTTTFVGVGLSSCINPPNAAVASMITTFPTLCPNLQTICLHSLPRNPMIVAAVSELLLTTNRNHLRHFCVDSPLTREAREVACKLPDLRELWVVAEGSTSLPTMLLPNLVELYVQYDRNRDWLQGFRGATLGRLGSVTFRAKSEPGDFLEEFQSVALATSIQNTLSGFRFYTSHSWNPNYSSLLAFNQLTELKIEFSCWHNGCSSRVDDDVIINLAQAMPKLEVLQLGGAPCETPTGVTFKGLIALACRCPQLSELRVHFRADSLVEATTSGEPPPLSERAATISRTNCALTDLHVGEIPIPEGSALAVALVLLQVFPHILNIKRHNPQWKSVAETIELFKRIGGHVRYAGEAHLPYLR
jgi:hypothetical protein